MSLRLMILFQLSANVEHVIFSSQNFRAVIANIFSLNKNGEWNSDRDIATKRLDTFLEDIITCFIGDKRISPKNPRNGSSYRNELENRNRITSLVKLKLSRGSADLDLTKVWYSQKWQSIISKLFQFVFFLYNEKVILFYISNAITS